LLAAFFVGEGSMWNAGKAKGNFVYIHITKHQTMKRINRKLCLAILLLFVTTQMNAQITVSGVTLPGTLKAGNTNLVLNGGGARVKFFMDIYVAGLYVTTQSNNPDAIAKANEPTAVKIHIVSGMATSERMKDAILEGFKKSTGGNTAPIQAKIDKFLKLFSQEPIVKGDVFDNVYTPEGGLQVSKNGKVLDTIDGLDFKTALWSIWLGNEPADKGLKAAMLGGK
jgi:hypothetical protein